MEKNFMTRKVQEFFRSKQDPAYQLINGNNRN